MSEIFLYERLYRSRQFTRLLQGMPCMLGIPGCTGGGEDTVPCHDPAHGSLKSDDFEVAAGCRSCHDYIDGRCRAGADEPMADRRLRWRLGQQRTMRYLLMHGYLRISRAPRPGTGP